MTKHSRKSPTYKTCKKDYSCDTLNLYSGITEIRVESSAFALFYNLNIKIDTKGLATFNLVEGKLTFPICDGKIHTYCDTLVGGKVYHDGTLVFNKGPLTLIFERLKMELKTAVITAHVICKSDIDSSVIDLGRQIVFDLSLKDLKTKGCNLYAEGNVRLSNYGSALLSDFFEVVTFSTGLLFGKAIVKAKL